MIDLLAGDLETLMEKLDVNLVTLAPDWRNRLLSVISNPNVAYILMLVGIYGLIYEFANPGAILPGTKSNPRHPLIREICGGIFVGVPDLWGTP